MTGRASVSAGNSGSAIPVSVSAQSVAQPGEFGRRAGVEAERASGEGVDTSASTPEGLAFFQVAESGSGRVSFASTRTDGDYQVFSDVVFEGEDGSDVRAETMRLAGARETPDGPVFDSLEILGLTGGDASEGAFTLDRIVVDKPSPLLASLIAARKQSPAVLDIGCGEGAFYDALRLFRPSAYVGTDISGFSVERAKERFAGQETFGPVRWAQGDGSRFETDETFDAIVFSECIEYLDDFETVLAHYRRKLRPDGIIGVTSWLSVRHLRLWRKLKKITTVEDESVVFSQWGGAWIVAVLTPR